MNTALSIDELHPSYITDEQGNKTSVILGVEAFQELLEDMADLAALASRKDEPVTSHADFMEELKKEGAV